MGTRSDRETASTITDDQLDVLYDQIDRLFQVVAEMGMKHSRLQADHDELEYWVERHWGER